MKKRYRIILGGVLLIGLGVGTNSTVAASQLIDSARLTNSLKHTILSGQTFTVDSTSDEVDVTPGDGVCLSASGQCTLRAAVMEANSTTGADRVKLTSGSTYTLSLAGAGENAAATGDLDITEDITIYTTSTRAIIDANSLDRIFEVTDADLTLTDLKLVNGSVTDEWGGAINFADSVGSKTLTLDNVRFYHNTCTTSTTGECGGGAISAKLNSSVVEINDSVFAENAANSSTFAATLVCGNACGGAILLTAENGSEVTITSSTFRANTVDALIAGAGGAAGGAIAAPDFKASTLTLEDDRFHSNVATIDVTGAGTLEGGAVYADLLDSTFNIADTRFKANSLTATTGGSSIMYGAGLALNTDGTTVALNDTVFSDNAMTNNGAGSQSTDGAGLQARVKGNGDSLSIVDSMFNGNIITTSSGGEGGGLKVSAHGTFSDPFTATIDGTVFKNNSVDNGQGGALKYNMASRSSTALEITNSTFSNNTATDAAGGIYLASALVSITNSTISGNSSGRHGGGIYIEGDETVNLRNVTVTDNASDQSGSGIYVLTATADIHLAHTIVADNIPYDSTSSASLASSDCSGNLTSDGYNIIGMLDTGRYSYCDFTSTTGDQVGSITTPIDPLLKALGNYGGSTKTHALRRTSPAIDAGDSAGCTDVDGNTLTTDQRNATRPADGNGDGTTVCDIGAFEKQ